MTSTYPLPLLEASFPLGSPGPSPLGIPLVLSAFVLTFSQALVQVSYLNGMMVVNLYEISQPIREPLTEVRNDVLYEAISIFLLVRQQLQRINQIATKA